MANGMQLFFEEQGWKLAGREIRLITEDDEGKPPTGLAKARSLVERVGGKLQNTVIHTFPNVSQFWTFKREDFLKNPVYSRDYPPCTKC